MIIRKLVWQKIRKNIYRQMSDNDVSLAALAIFLNDGLGFETYIDFLLDKNEQKFVGNLSWLKKNGNMISIDIDDYVYPDIPIFTTTISNLLLILEEYKKLFLQEVDRIEIAIDELGQVTITGE